MSYTPPNVFVNNGPLDADALQANNDSLKIYVDGGAVPADVSAASWVRAPHIMRGTYIPLQNLHEFATGVVRGSTYTDLDLVFSADRYRTPAPGYPKETNFINATEWTNESQTWDSRIGWHVFPKHPPLISTITTTADQCNKTTVLGSYKAFTGQENIAGNFRNSGAPFANSISGLYRRRAVQNWEYVNNAGGQVGLTVTTQWYVTANNVVNDYADFGYNLEVYYQ